MLALPGYHVVEQLFESHRTIVYRAQKQDSRQPVIIKFLKNPHPSLEEATRFRREYEITRNLAIEGAVKTFSLDHYNNTYFMTVEDIGGLALDQWMNELAQSNPPGFMPMKLFFQLALEITHILIRLHQAQIIHKDINPANVIYNPESGQLRIIDFGCSTFLAQERPIPGHPILLEGTLLYISPEQTGRMNRAIDYRTDYYSLGATFYHLLTGQPPFISSDPLELVHSHIARQPVQPHLINPDIPMPLSALIMKLMAKDAEQRYLSPQGLLADLTECKKQYEATGLINPFVLGQHDISDRFQIPEKLYGREIQREKLLQAFERVAGGGSELMLVTGDSGIGKTALIQEIYKPVTRQRGYFVTGKFDQLQRSIPYSGWIQALRTLMRQILIESDAQIKIWRERLLEALGDSGRIVIEEIPELELIIGPQPPVPELGPMEALIRFNLMFQSFIKVFSQPEHPLVIFLDDLQWADTASLKLLESLFDTPEKSSLFVILAYRDKEVESAHPLLLTIDQMVKTGIEPNAIALKPLAIPEITNLLADTFHCQPRKTRPLAELVYRKCWGNPYLLLEFLRYLYEQHYIVFDPDRNAWDWDLEQIDSMGIGDRVAELMEEKVSHLPETTRGILCKAACLGSAFNLKTLAFVTELIPSEVAQMIWVAVRDGLVVPLGDAYKLAMVETEDTQRPADSIIDVEYRFAHDKVRQSFYEMIPAAQRPEVHLALGRSLSALPKKDQERSLFDIVNQFNLSYPLVCQEVNRSKLAQLNLKAGKKASQSAAFDAALTYYQIGLELLPAAAWNEYYELTLSLHLGIMQCAYLCGNLELTERMGEKALNHVTDLLDVVKIQTIIVQALWAQNRLEQSIETALNLLARLGLELPAFPDVNDLTAALADTSTLLAGRSNEELIQLPIMTDPQKLAIMDVLLSIAAPAYFARPLLYFLISLTQIGLSVEYGNTPATAAAYANYALILSSMAGDIDNGWRVGELALALEAKLNAKTFRAIVNQLINWFVRPWKESIRELPARFLDVYKSGLETGAVVYAAGALGAARIHDFLAGGDLERLAQEMEAGAQAISKLRQEPALQMNNVFRQVILNLSGKSANPALLAGPVYHAAQMEEQHKQDNNRFALALLYYNQMYLAYLFGNLTDAIAYSDQAESYLDGAAGTIFVPLYHFYDSLLRLAVYQTLSKSERDQVLSRVQSHLGKLTHWAQHAPMNHLHKCRLVEAERLRVMGLHQEAMDLYDQAIDLSQQNAYPNETALALELTARFYLNKGSLRIARVYFRDALFTYNRWGAKAKATDLERRYPVAFSDQRVIEPSVFVHSLHNSTTATNVSQALDLASVIKASQAISSEIVLPQLLGRLMLVLMENAGAERGFLVLEKNGEWVVEAASYVDEKISTSLISQPLEEAADHLAVSVVHYVLRCCETLVLGAADPGDFSRDPYIQKRHPRSILSLPIIGRGQTLGALYLENNLASDAFTPERVSFLGILASQIAISLENARLYVSLEESHTEIAAWNQRLEQLVHDRTRELEEANEKLKELDHLKTDFLSLVSHELRTPITSIIGFAELIRKKFNDAILPKVSDTDKVGGRAINSIQQYINIVTTEGTRLTILINDLLDITKMEAGKMEWRMESVSLAGVITHAADATAPLFEQKNLPLELGIEPDLPRITGDKDRLIQVFINLFSNAVKFTEQGRVSCSVMLEDGELKVRIADTGVGIDRQNQKTIFERFRQIDSVSGGIQKGTGLGLPICRQIIEHHGGQLSVQSEPGKGAIFFFNLPLDQTAATE